MLTQAQEERLLTALEVLVETAPNESHLAVTATARRSRPGVVIAVSFIVVLAVFLPLRLIQNRSEPLDPPSTSFPTSSLQPNTTIPPGEQDGTAISLGDPVVVTSSPGELRSLVARDGALYASMVGPTDKVVRSTDGGSSWETVLEANPGDAEGLFGVGDLVVLVVDDDDPARDTVVPSSVVSEAPRVLVFDPDTGQSSEVRLPRPEDPPMEPIPLDGSVEECSLGGYQSWMNANGVASGSRIVVTGSHQLVGTLADGTVLCDGQVYQHFTWASDDGGGTWQMNESPPLGRIAWTGERYVAWMAPGIDDAKGTGPSSLAVSADGINWAAGPSMPALPDGSILSGTAITVDDESVVAWAGVNGWTADVPEDITDPEQLREVLDISKDMEVEDVLDSIDVDFPLDEGEKEAIARFNGRSAPIGAVVAISTDYGSTWSTTYVPEPITGVVRVNDAFVGLTSSFGESSTPDELQSSLLVSLDGITWTKAIDLPEFAYGPLFLAASTDAIYVRGEQTGSLWRIPIS